jgi:hypothetical protein
MVVLVVLVLVDVVLVVLVAVVGLVLSWTGQEKFGTKTSGPSEE